MATDTAIIGNPEAARAQPASETVAALRNLSAEVLSEELREKFNDQTWRALRERGDSANRLDVANWRKIKNLKALLDLAKDVVATEQASPPIEQEERGKAALTELFEEAKNGDTPIMVERIVNDIDEIVRHVRFNGWQATHAGEREVKMALRKTLFKYPRSFRNESRSSIGDFQYFITRTNTWKIQRNMRFILSSKR